MQVRERDFFREPLSEAELRALLGGRPPAEAFAWRSPRAKAMNLDPAHPPSDEELLRLMLEVPYLVRRPVVRLHGQTIFGFDRQRLETVLSSRALKDGEYRGAEHL